MDLWSHRFGSLRIFYGKVPADQAHEVPYHHRKAQSWLKKVQHAHLCQSSVNTWMYGVGQLFSIIKLYKGYGTFIHLGFSYFWLTSFIFAAQDYNFGNCANTEPSEAGQCDIKYTLEAFALSAL